MGLHSQTPPTAIPRSGLSRPKCARNPGRTPSGPPYRPAGVAAVCLLSDFCDRRQKSGDAALVPDARAGARLVRRAELARLRGPDDHHDARLGTDTMETVSQLARIEPGKLGARDEHVGLQARREEAGRELEHLPAVTRVGDHLQALVL